MGYSRMPSAFFKREVFMTQNISFQSSFNRLPDDVVFEVFSFLSVPETARNSCLNKTIQRVVQEYFSRVLWPQIKGVPIDSFVGKIRDRAAKSNENPTILHIFREIDRKVSKITSEKLGNLSPEIKCKLIYPPRTCPLSDPPREVLSYADYSKLNQMLENLSLMVGIEKISSPGSFFQKTEEKKLTLEQAADQIRDALKKPIPRDKLKELDLRDLLNLENEEAVYRILTFSKDHIEVNILRLWNWLIEKNKCISVIKPLLRLKTIREVIGLGLTLAIQKHSFKVVDEILDLTTSKKIAAEAFKDITLENCPKLARKLLEGNKVSQRVMEKEFSRAIRYGRQEIVCELSNRVSEVTCAIGLERAAIFGQVEIVKKLLGKVSKTVRGDVLEHVVFMGNIEMVREFLDQGVPEETVERMFMETVLFGLSHVSEELLRGNLSREAVRRVFRFVAEYDRSKSKKASTTKSK